MKLTILGNNGPYPKAGGTCSGYLLENNDTKVLLDCGNGIFSNFQNVCNLEDLDAIILSHLHPDHISDIFILRYALQFKDLSLKLFAPNEPLDEYERLYYRTFNLNSINEKKNLKIGDMKFKFSKMEHVIPNYAISIQSDDKTFVYSGDTSYTNELIRFSKDADLLLCEAGVLEKDIGKRPPHLSPKQAVNIANSARVKKLILTHFYPEYSLNMYENEVKEHINDSIEFAKEMKSYDF